MLDKIAKVEIYVVTIPRKTPYLGPLADNEQVNEKGYFIRRGNKTIYPINDRSVLVKLTTEDGASGWGETYGLCAPEATVAIIADLLTPLVIGREPDDVMAFNNDAYDQVRVRGYTGGFYADATAAIDIALWDLRGKLRNVPLHSLLGKQKRTRIPAYVSGLPGASLSEKCAMAGNWKSKGFNAIKFAAVVSAEGVSEEMQALRNSLGDEIHIMVDLHWKYSAADAIALITRIERFVPFFAEAPCAPEDLGGLARVISGVKTPIAAGEEWRTEHDARLRLDCGLPIMQPEIGHTGVTQFLRIARLGESFNCRIIPHASVGIGFYQAASLHAAVVVDDLPYHEYQHSVFDRNLRFVTTDMACESGYYQVPSGPGLGVVPSEELWSYAQQFQ